MIILRSWLTRQAVVLGCAAVAAVPVLTGVVAAPGASAAVIQARSPRTVPGGSQLWIAKYNQVSGSSSVANSVAVNPAGTVVFVTGGSTPGSAGSTFPFDYATIAYNAVTGGQMWVSRYHEPAGGQDIANSVSVSPDGATVYVTGQSAGSGTGDDYATVAYDAATGSQLWASRYDGPAHGDDRALVVKVSQDGKTVFVTGGSAAANNKNDYATVAYNAATGAQLWVSRYDGPGHGNDFATGLVLAPHGGPVVVTGGSTGKHSNFDYATVAYNSVTGKQMWVARYNGPGNNKDYAHSIARNPGGSLVYVTGASRGGPTGVDFATIAYQMFTGRVAWIARYNGPANNTDDAVSVVANPRLHLVYVSGYSRGAGGQAYATIAYDSVTGARRWIARYAAPGSSNNLAVASAVSQSGKTIYVTGSSEGGPVDIGYLTVGFSAVTGKRLWATRYTGVTRSLALSIAVNGSQVFITGLADPNYATIAYRA